MKEEKLNNWAIAYGKVMEPGFVYSHMSSEEKHYKGMVSVMRTSGVQDVIPVVISETLLGKEEYEGKFITIFGQWRSRTIRRDNRQMLDMFLLAEHVPGFHNSFWGCNCVFLTGEVSKKPVYRKTPSGRDICDIMLSVEDTENGRLQLIPCIAWGKDAVWSKQLHKGEKVCICGRIQSRKYSKRLGNGMEEDRIVYEVSASVVEKVQESGNHEFWKTVLTTCLESKEKEGEKMTDQKAKDLLEKGHSLEELIECFEDKQEQHDIYVNSALVYPDFNTIIRALKIMQEISSDNGTSVKDAEERDKQVEESAFTTNMAIGGFALIGEVQPEDMKRFMSSKKNKDM